MITAIFPDSSKTAIKIHWRSSTSDHNKIHILSILYRRPPSAEKIGSLRWPWRSSAIARVDRDSSKTASTSSPWRPSEEYRWNGSFSSIHCRRPPTLHGWRPSTALAAFTWKYMTAQHACRSPRSRFRSAVAALALCRVRGERGRGAERASEYTWQEILVPFHVQKARVHRYMEESVGGQNTNERIVTIRFPGFFVPTSSGLRQIG